MSSRLVALDAAVRGEVERQLDALRTAPVREVVGYVPDVDTMLERLDALTFVGRPTRFATCYPNEGWSSARRGVVTCSYADAPHPPYPGMGEYPLEAFVWERTRRGLRIVASFHAGYGYDCESGHVHEPGRFERLTVARHGIDGYLLSVRDVWEDSNPTTARTWVYACSRASGTCARVEEDYARCEWTDRGPRCSERYEGTASVRRGLLTVRIDRGELPESLRAPLDLRSITPSPPAVPRARAPRGCRVVVHDRSPPLQVRARPARHAPVVGTLRQGAEVRIATPARGRWVQVRAPVEGWVWSRYLRAVCGPR